MSGFGSYRNCCIFPENKTFNIVAKIGGNLVNVRFVVGGNSGYYRISFPINDVDVYIYTNQKTVKSALKTYGKFFKAFSKGYAQHYFHVNFNNNVSSVSVWFTEKFES